MALRWDFNEDKMGYALYKDGTRRPMYNGNAFVIVNNEWEDGDKRYYSLHTFFADEKHAKRCLGLDKAYAKENPNQKPFFIDTVIWRGNPDGEDLEIPLEKIVLYSKARNAKKLAELLIKAFDNITIEMKEEVE